MEATKKQKIMIDLQAYRQCSEVLLPKCRQIDKYILKKEQTGIMCLFDNHYTTTSKNNLI